MELDIPNIFLRDDDIPSFIHLEKGAHDDYLTIKFC